MPPRIVVVAVFIALVAAACSSDPAVEVEAIETTAAPTTEPQDVDLEPVTSVTETEAEAETEAPSTSAAEGEGEGDVIVKDPPLGEQVGEVTVVGEILPLMPQQVPVTEPENDSAIGMVAPEITGTDFGGEPVEIVADGTPKVIMFVAHWCPHCQREVPAVTGLIEAGAVPEGLELIIVSTSVREGEGNYPPQTWLQNEGWPGPILRDAESFDALIAFGAGGFPFSVYLNADHQVVTRSAGEIPSDILEQLWLATASG